MFEAGSVIQGERTDAAFVAAVDHMEHELAEVTGLWNATAGRLVGLVSEALAEGLWCQSGVHSPEQWVAWQCGVSAGRARQLVAVARRLPDLPACAEALRAGEITIDHAAAICRHTPAWADGEVTALAKQVTVAQLVRALRRYVFEPEQAAGEPVGPEEQRSVRFGLVSETRWRMVVDTTIDEGAVLEAGLAAFRDQLFHDRARSGDRDAAAAVSWADALVELFEHAMAQGATSRPHTDRYRVWFHYGFDAAGNPALAPHGREALPQSLRRYWMCDASVVPVSEVGGVAVSVGRAQRIVPDRTRKLIEHRDGGCRAPGCNHNRWVQVHHIVHWEDGGGTDSANLICLCAHHHRLHHRGELGIAGDADDPEGVVFTDKRGRTLTGRGRPAPPGHPPGRAPSCTARRLGIPPSSWKPPSGERLDYACLDFGLP